MLRDSTSDRDETTVLALFDAINAKDRAAFLATLDPDAVYTFHHEGFDPASGHQQIGAVWDAMLGSFPDMREDIVSLYVRPDHAVVHWVMTGTLAGPWRIGARILLPEGPQPACSLRGVDIFTLRNGLVVAKDTYADVGVWFETYGHLPTVPAAQAA